mmetsp:Transcript_21243/g.38768  ORF Transcript_21243/g.38768 Transcript_21243/m.38768 type:complete len:457 (-) Transcript_21243:145-1515(-)
MITYQKSPFGLDSLFAVYGTSWPFGVLPGGFAAVVSLVLSHWEDADEVVSNRDEFVSHPYAFQLFAYLLGFVIVFRTQLAYQRYWEAVGALQAMSAKWLDGSLMAIVFDAGGTNDTPLLWGTHDRESMQDTIENSEKGGPCHKQFYREVVHLCSLLHAVALQHLRDDPNLDNLQFAACTEEDASTIRRVQSEAASVTSLSSKGGNGGGPPIRYGFPTFSEPDLRDTLAQQKLPVLDGLSESERDALETDAVGQPISTEARVAMVESWLMRRCLARQKFEQGHSAYTSPPILSRIYQVLSDGTLWFGAASKIAQTPFPFPYRNIISIFLWMYTLMVPVLINGIIMNVTLRAILCFCTVFAYHALNNIGDNLEDPYLPYDPNELPLPSMQHSVNMRLYAFGVTPRRSRTSGQASPTRWFSRPEMSASSPVRTGSPPELQGIPTDTPDSKGGGTEVVTF